MSSGNKVIALLATARIANVPSVVSNLGVGILLGYFVDPIADFVKPWWLSVAVVMLYISGNFLNDWADRDWDKQHRPERALPRGLFSASSYLAVAVLGILAGLVIAACYGALTLSLAVILVALIVLYTRVHKRAAWSVIPMGLCRACLPLIGYASYAGELSVVAFFPAAALLIYIIALSLSARWEARGDLPAREKWMARGLLFGSGLIAAAFPIFQQQNFGWIGLVSFFFWMMICVGKYQSPVPVHVSALLAGIPLVDWIVTLPMALFFLKNENDWIVITTLLLAPLAFITGRLLQRLAPAT